MELENIPELSAHNPQRLNIEERSVNQQALYQTLNYYGLMSLTQQNLHHSS
jgi:hypothetical protein